MTTARVRPRSWAEGACIEHSWVTHSSDSPDVPRGFDGLFRHPRSYPGSTAAQGAKTLSPLYPEHLPGHPGSRSAQAAPAPPRGPTAEPGSTLGCLRCRIQTHKTLSHPLGFHALPQEQGTKTASLFGIHKINQERLQNLSVFPQTYLTILLRGLEEQKEKLLEKALCCYLLSCDQHQISNPHLWAEN